MGATRGKPPESPRVGRPRLRTDVLVEAALQIVDEDGAEALTMRTLAHRLTSSTATLYRHFPNRSALVVAVIDRVLGEIISGTAGVDSLTWQDAMRTVATEYYAALRRHPGAARLLADHTPAGPNAMALRELWLRTMVNAGFPVDLAVRCGALMASYVQGFAVQLSGRRAVAELDHGALAAAVGQLDPARFPTLILAMRSGVAPVPLDEEFSFGLELIMDGLTAVVEQQQR